MNNTRDDDSDHSQNLMLSKLDLDTISDIFHEVPASSICISSLIPLSNRQANDHEINTYLSEAANQMSMPFSHRLNYDLQSIQ